MKIAERTAAWRRERQVLLRVSRAAWRQEQAERERTWALASARAEGVSIRALAAAAGLSSSRVHQIVAVADLGELDAGARGGRAGPSRGRGGAAPARPGPGRGRPVAGGRRTGQRGSRPRRGTGLPGGGLRRRGRGLRRGRAGGVRRVAGAPGPPGALPPRALGRARPSVPRTGGAARAARVARATGASWPTGAPWPTGAVRAGRLDARSGRPGFPAARPVSGSRPRRC